MNSCYYDNDEDFAVDIPDIPGDQEIKYGAEIQPIWNSKCTDCHNESRSPDLRVNVSYNELVPQYVIADDAENSPLYIKLQTGAHDGRATASEMNLIKAWINKGALNN